MPTIHYVKRALKSKRAHGIKKGHGYYWWKVYRGGRRYSTVKPTKSQICSSPYKRDYWKVVELLDALKSMGEITIHVQIKGILQILNRCADSFMRLKDTQLGTLEYLPKGLQRGKGGQIKQRRAEACETAYNQIRDIMDDRNLDSQELFIKLSELSIAPPE